ncbi:Gfo/Idh/MocA family oxidoreductase, partial [Pelagibacteraceae bacterium]|nr:Gfo/Idh/MocA family oxidoreductase [Pelagibacteraceae bacterium]
MNKVFKVGLVGCGHISETYFRAQEYFNNIKIIRCADINNEAAEKCAKTYDVKASNINDIFKDKDIEIILNLTIPKAHFEVSEKALLSGKHSYSEKPLDLDLNKIIKCRKYIEKFSPRIQIGFNRRYDPGHYYLKKSIEKKKIGILQKIIITCRDPAPPPLAYLKTAGGIFKDMIIHDFDLIRFYLKNDPIKEVFATTSDLSEYSKLFKKVKDFELATVVLKSQKGVLCTINNARHCSYGHDQRVEIFGTKGMLISNNK